jgi:hypothetical protein
MYTNFPLEPLKKAVEAEVISAMKFLCKEYFNIHEDNYPSITWATESPRKNPQPYDSRCNEMMSPNAARFSS